MLNGLQSADQVFHSYMVLTFALECLPISILFRILFSLFRSLGLLNWSKSIRYMQQTSVYKSSKCFYLVQAFVHFQKKSRPAAKKNIWLFGAQKLGPSEVISSTPTKNSRSFQSNYLILQRVRIPMRRIFFPNEAQNRID